MTNPRDEWTGTRRREVQINAVSLFAAVDLDGRDGSNWGQKALGTGCRRGG